jgi:hypothetical protein
MKILSPKQVEEACTRYLAGESCNTIGKSYGVTGSSIFGLLKRRHIQLRSPSESQITPMLGRRFGKLEVLERDGRASNGCAMWKCRCQCGMVKSIDGSLLRRGDIVSCGCFAREQATKHGKCATVAYALWESAKARAKKLGVPFSLTLSDITIPERCPVLGIPLQSMPRACSDQSPTLDRIDASRGYVAGNVMVISHRANSIKRSATIGELQLVIKYMQTYGVRTTHESRREAASGIPRR